MKIEQKSEDSAAPFVLVEDTTILVPILKARLPRSAHVYNMALFHSKYTPVMKAFVLNGEVSDKSWIVFINHREDYGRDVNISPPPEPEITEEIKQAFLHSSIIDWNKPYFFADIDRTISPMIIEIGTLIKGNSTSIHPCKYYVIDPEKAKELVIPKIPDGEVKPLDVELGVNFTVDTWKFTKKGSREYVQKIVERNNSSGIYVNGKLVSAAITAANGRMSFLYTLREHRQKGLAKVCMLYLMKSLAQDGFVPCSGVEVTNYPSQKFHEKLGMTESHIVDYVYYTADNNDL